MCPTNVAINAVSQVLNSFQITIDDEPIDGFNITFLRNLMGVVSQEPILFGTTIEENIRFGHMDMTRQDMIKASKMANAHNFVSKLPEACTELLF